MLALFGGFLVKLLGSGIAAPVLEYFRQRDTSRRDIAVGTIDADRQRDLATLQAAVDTNHLRAASQTEFMWLIYLIAFGPAIHFTSVFLDSTPFWTPFGAHVVGAWSVPQVPEPYSTYEGQILLSFFLLSPVLAVAKGAASALIKR